MFLEVETDFLVMNVEFDLYKGSEEYFSKSHGNWLPGDPPHIKLKHVWIGHSNGRIDILNNISSSEKSSIEDYCIENAQD